jgi:hypothetical protein
MSLITRSNIPSLLRPGLQAVFYDYHTYPTLWKKVYQTHHSDKAVEYDVEMQGLPLAQLKSDGAPVAMGNMQEAYKTSYVNQFYGIGFQITRGAIEDNQYQADFPQQTEQLRTSLDTLKNINAMFPFNNAFNEASTVSDGLPLCSTAHPIANGPLQANTFSNGVQFNEAAVEDAITLIKGWRSQSGLNTNINCMKVLIPQARAFDAARIFKSEFTPSSANNAVNPIVSDKYMPGGYHVNVFINNPNYWFILTDETNGFKHFLRTPLDIDFITDVVTDTVTVRAVERYSFGCSNWRAVFGAYGA